MSVVVRMEMPKSCWVCPFGIDGYIWDENDARTHHVRLCSQHRDVEYRVLKNNDNDRPWYCDSFICQLPEGHGRLGDLDELGRKINEARIRVMQDGQDTNPYWECGDIIASEPTIIPAERSKI